MTPLLCLLTITAVNPVFVASAKGNVASGKYVIEIRGETAIDPSQVTARMNGDLLTMYVAGGKVRADNRAWGNGRERVNAHRHVGKIELEASLPTSACGGSVNIAAAGEGVVVATVNCPTLAASARAERVADKVKEKIAPVAIVTPKEPESAPKVVVAAAAATPAHESDALLAAVALVPAVAPAVVPAPKVKVIEANPVPLPPTKPSAPIAKAEAPVADTVSLWGAAAKALVPVLLLGALGIVGLRFAKKRRGMGRHVQILETTQLGPKRSLIVAKVGGETLLLGSSEAGIALIQVRPSASMQDERPQPDTDEHLDISPKWADVLPADFTAKPANDEDGGQAKMLSRLFKKRRTDIPEAWPFANVLDASMLDESIEDRELRDKLAMGMEARVP